MRDVELGTEMDVKDKKVLVVGLGVSGRAAAELLASRGAVVKVTEASDSDEIRKNIEILARLGVETQAGGHTAEFCSGQDLVVTSPGVDPGSLPISTARKEEIPVIGELELGFAFCKAPIIAITGTNGKSTTVRLLGQILSLAGKHTVVCGNIGNPLCGEIGTISKESVVVAEISSFQLETIKKFRPYVAVLLNVTEDHYDRHGNLDEYKIQKFRIFENQTEYDWAVLNSELATESALKKVKSRILFYGGKESNFSISGDNIVLRRDGEERVLASAADIPIKGRHNMENAACALLVADIMGVGTSVAVKAVKDFSGLDHRFELVLSSAGVDFIDDSKATNIDATRRALDSVNKKVVLIAGGRDKGGDYKSITRQVRDKVKAMVLIGEARQRIKQAFAREVAIYETADMYEAVRKASDMAGQGEVVLLSPMCSSFDMFKSYKHRGRVFQNAVRKYVSGIKDEQGR
jgi:UDP-N-acetylmuramoylalanine--D-glutamate ligase